MTAGISTREASILLRYRSPDNFDVVNIKP